MKRMIGLKQFAIACLLWCGVAASGVTAGATSIAEDGELKLIVQRERLKREIAKSPYTAFEKLQGKLEGVQRVRVELGKDLQAMQDMGKQVKQQLVKLEERAKNKAQEMILTLDEARELGLDPKVVKEKEKTLSDHLQKTRNLIDELGVVSKEIHQKVSTAQEELKEAEDLQIEIEKQMKTLRVKAQADRARVTELKKKLNAVKEKLKK